MATPVTAHANVPGVEHQGVSFPPFDATTFGSQLLWLAISFGALYLLMSKVIVPRLSAIIQDRNARIAGDLKAATDAKAQAEAAIAAYEKSVGEAKARAQTLVHETRDKAAAETASKRQSLEAELADKLAAAEATIAAGKAKAMSNVRGIAVEATSAIVERLTGAAPAETAVTSAVDSAISAR